MNLLKTLSNHKAIFAGVLAGIVAVTGVVVTFSSSHADDEYKYGGIVYGSTVTDSSSPDFWSLESVSGGNTYQNYAFPSNMTISQNLNIGFSENVYAVSAESVISAQKTAPDASNLSTDISSLISGGNTVKDLYVLDDTVIDQDSRTLGIDVAPSAVVTNGVDSTANTSNCYKNNTKWNDLSEINGSVDNNYYTDSTKPQVTLAGTYTYYVPVYGTDSVSVSMSDTLISYYRTYLNNIASDDTVNGTDNRQYYAYNCIAIDYSKCNDGSEIYDILNGCFTENEYNVSSNTNGWHVYNSSDEIPLYSGDNRLTKVYVLTANRAYFYNSVTKSDSSVVFNRFFMLLYESYEFDINYFSRVDAPVISSTGITSDGFSANPGTSATGAADISIWDTIYLASETGTVPQYYFSDTELSDPDADIKETDWKNASGTDSSCHFDLKDYGKKYLYVRAKYKVLNNKDNYGTKDALGNNIVKETSKVVCQKLNYLDSYSDNVTAVVYDQSTSNAKQGNLVKQGDTITLTANSDNAVYYIVSYGTPIDFVSGNSFIGLNKTSDVPGTTSLIGNTPSDEAKMTVGTINDGSSQYTVVRINGVWFKLYSSTEDTVKTGVISSGDSITIGTELNSTNNVLYVYAFGLDNGTEPATEVQSYQYYLDLNAPYVRGFSGNEPVSGILSIPEDDYLQLSTVNNTSNNILELPAGSKPEYYLSNTKISGTGTITEWKNDINYDSYVANGEYDYICTRYKYTANDGSIITTTPAWTQINYYNDAPMSRTVTVKADGNALNNGSIISAGSKITFTKSKDESKVFYYTDYDNSIGSITLTQLSPLVSDDFNLYTQLSVNASDTGTILKSLTENGVTAYYLRINGLWYRVSGNIDVYEYDASAGINVTNDILKDSCLKLYTLEVLEGENPQLSFTSATYPAALTTPSISILDYTTYDSATNTIAAKDVDKSSSGLVKEVTISSDGMVRLNRVSENEYIGSGSAVDTGILQYYFSSIEISDANSVTGWITYDGSGNGWIDLPSSGLPVYLYVRTYYSDASALGVTPTGNYPIDCYKFTSIDKSDCQVTITMSDATATISSVNGTTLYYAVGTKKPKLSVVSSFPDSLGSSSGMTNYILVNGVLYYSDIPLYKVTSSDSASKIVAVYNFDASVMSSNVYALAVMDGIEPEDGYEFTSASYMNTSLGSVVRVDFESDYALGNSSTWATEGGVNIFSSSKSKDDTVCFYITDNSGIDSTLTTGIQYFLSTSKVSSASISNWTTSTGTDNFVALSGNSYIYTRLYVEGVGYSNVVCWKVNLLDDCEYDTAYVPATASSIDVGSTITATAKITDASGTISDADLLIYSIDQDNTPSVSKVSYSDRISKNLDAICAGAENSDTMAAKTVNGTSYIIDTSGNSTCYYIKLNNLWYKTSDNVVLYEGNELSTETDELLRTYNVFSLYVLSVADIGIEPDNFSVARYTYAMNNTVPTPVSSPTTPDADGNAAVLDIGDTITISFDSTVPSGTMIFYTLNGSVPVIENTADGIVAGTNTYLYDSEGITITNSMGTPGENLTINAQGVYYTYQNGSWYRAYNDSSVARFAFKIGELDEVEAITSIPSTSSDSPEMVAPGSYIQLSTATANAEIYYTTDGSEPTYTRTLNEDGEYVYAPGEGTSVYSKGIMMPAHDGTSTYFTITAIGVATNMQPSDFCRFVFAYPAVVSAPYSTPAEGAVTENTEVSLATAISGAIIYYEVAYDGNVPADPTTSSNIFATGSSIPFKITRKTIIKAFAVKDGMSSAILTFTYTVAEKLAVPTPSVANGSVVSSGTILNLNSTAGATIYYTTDGSDPKLSTNNNVMIGTSLVLTGDAGTAITVRTYASKTGYSDSDSGVYTYTISAYEGGVYADKETGSTLQSGSVVHLSTDVTGATIYYTTDGSIPTISSASGSSVTINGEPGDNVTLLAFALVSGTTTSTGKGTFIYTIMDQLAAPNFSVPDGAIFTEEATLTISSEKGRIYYTTDGSVPTIGSNLYRSGIKITGPVTIKAIAVADDMQTSDVATCTYGFADQVETPVCNVENGELEVGTEITFETSTEGAVIYYRTDGKTPDPNDSMTTTRYTGPITIDKATNFKVIAVKEHMQDSAVLSAGFTVKEVEVVEETEETVETDETTNGRLQSRRDYMSEAEGPSYSDVIKKNAVYGVVLSSDEGVVEDDATLVVETEAKTETEEKLVRNALGSSYEITQVYNISLYKDGEEIEPNGTIEIGIPIPEENENSIVEIVHILDNGTVAVCETRRSGGVAYAKVDSLSNFAIASPTVEESSGSGFPIRPVLYGLIVALIIGGALLIYHANKSRREDLENE